MNPQERFHATMHYQPRDRCPIVEFGFWPETLLTWEQDGFPKGGDPRLFIGMDAPWVVVPDHYYGITREVKRLAPLVEEGGYIPTTDHAVPPNVPLQNYRHYIHEARRVWGQHEVRYVR
ncbi:MAG: hypothetical protein HY360_20460 [Verrucomicrobia bacterium]|nr:hypothetical protein [Verrucomicrobiota bacterium]